MKQIKIGDKKISLEFVQHVDKNDVVEVTFHKFDEKITSQFNLEDLKIAFRFFLE